jgi:NAD(P)-dependent dehydrogenase (short-subunit alcohol dehydrogenase family)
VILGYDGEVALITGGTRGIGQAIATALLAEGCSVMVTGKNQRTQAELAALFPGAGDRVAVLAGDTSDPATAQSLVDATVERFGRLDILVNNAAGYTEGDVFGSSDSDWEALIDTKLLGYVRMSRAAVKFLAQSPAASILNVAGILSIQPRPTAAQASVVNAGVVTFSRVAARELGPRGITVNAISPGAVRASRFDSRISNYIAENGGTKDEAERALLKASPTGRPAELDEIGMLATLMCAPKMRSLAGAHVVIDAGLTT